MKYKNEKDLKIIIRNLRVFKGSLLGMESEYNADMSDYYIHNIICDINDLIDHLERIIKNESDNG